MGMFVFSSRSGSRSEPHVCHGHAEAQLVFLQHPPGAAVLPLTPPPPPQGDVQLFRLSLGSWVLFLQIIYLGLHRGVDTTLLGVFSFRESSGASLAP